MKNQIVNFTASELSNNHNVHTEGVSIGESEAIQNLMDLFQLADSSQYQRSVSWYSSANGIAVELAAKSRYNVFQIAGLLSSYSPMCDWDVNVLIVERFITLTKQQVKDLSETGFVDGVKLSTSQKNKKAAAIALLVDPTKDEVLAYFSKPTSRKTKNFYLSILLDKNTCALDVHALNALYHGVKGSRAAHFPGLSVSSNVKYPYIVNLYRVAAQKAGQTLSDFQAVVWVSYRENVLNRAAHNTI